MAGIPPRTYRYPKAVVFNAVLKAVRNLGYRIQSVDPANGLLTFETGMSFRSWAGQKMSVLLLENANGTTEVDISGVAAQSGVVLQVFDWGELGSIGGKVHEALAQQLRYIPRRHEEDLSQEIAAPGDIFRCPHCQMELQAGPELAGQIVVCPGCQGEISL